MLTLKRWIELVLFWKSGKTESLWTLSVDAWIQDTLAYIDQWSLQLDAQILAKTIPL